MGGLLPARVAGRLTVAHTEKGRASRRGPSNLSVQSTRRWQRRGDSTRPERRYPVALLRPFGQQVRPYSTCTARAEGAPECVR